MKTVIIFVLLCLLPAVSLAEDYAAGSGKRHIYHRSGKVIGGQITDGKDIYGITWSKHEDFERIVLEISEASWGTEEKAPAEVPCHFVIKHENYPPRLVFTLSGVRAFSAKMPACKDSDLMRDIYRIIYLDDAGARFAVAFSKLIEFEVYERHDPARIVVDIRPIGAVPIYSLRTYSMKSSEKLGHLEEEILHLGGTNVRIVRSEGDLYFVEEGYHDCEKEVELRRWFYSEKGIRLFIEKRLPLDTPAEVKEAETEEKQR